MDREAWQATAHSVTESDMTEHASTTYIEELKIKEKNSIKCWQWYRATDNAHAFLIET